MEKEVKEQIKVYKIQSKILMTIHCTMKWKFWSERYSPSCG